MSRFTIEPGGRIEGRIRVPGDKSISHRAVMLSAIAGGTARIRGLLTGTDVLATAQAFREMGVSIELSDAGTATVDGVGLDGLKAPAGALDLGNSGTAMRLLAGLLCGQRFGATLVGDESLNRRPMRRVTEPLSEMGASIETDAEGTPPVVIRPAGGLTAIHYRLPVASAQVKSAVLLAGLYAAGRTCVAEPAPLRDHTERMLRGLGVPVTRDGEWTCLEPAQPAARDIEVPADFSSAAFFLVAASICPGSALRLADVGVNPTRTGLLTVLREMGADITVENEREIAGEPIADLVVRGAELSGIDIPPEVVPLAIDEFPVICAAAAVAAGTTRISGAGELRYKESDRIRAMAEGLKTLGAGVAETDDGMVIEGRDTLDGGRVDSFADHRIAMAFAVAGLRARGLVEILDVDNVATSFPTFETLAREAGMALSRLD